jgi:integrase
LTVGEVAALWLTGKVNLKPTTQARYKAAMEVHIDPMWKHVSLDHVEHSNVQDWVIGMAASGLSGASVRKAYGVLAAILDRAVRDRRLPSNPARGVDLPAVKQRRRKYLTAVEVEALAEAAAALPDVRPRRATDQAFAQYKIVVLVLAYCGLRWSEMAALRIGRVDLMRRRLEVAEAMTEVNGSELAWGTPKSHGRRSVPIPKFIAEQLIEHVAGKDADELVFAAPGGGVLRNRNARRAWFDAAADATRASSHCRFARGERWREREGRAAHARAQERGHDAGRVQRPVRRRSRCCRRAPGRGCTRCCCCPFVAQGPDQ